MSSNDFNVRKLIIHPICLTDLYHAHLSGFFYFVMKFKNYWFKEIWGNLNIRLIIGPFRFLSIDIDMSRNFYSITFINFTIRNR